MLMTRKLYELIRDLAPLADNGADELKRNAADADERLEAVEARSIVSRAEWYVEEFSEQYANDDLPE